MPGQLLALVALLAGPGPAADSATPATHAYVIERGTMAMPDGTRLAVTWWVPVPRTPGERFPALLELLPYRKDDEFYARDFPLYDWFARRGFLLAKVDVRGTGGSTGPVPPREYSEAELDDAVEIIRQLAADRRSNGRVGMWGISWGGFNAIQVALRRPPALGAILALHASDDLYHDDVRYVDGALHVDRYALQIDHGKGLPRTPGYPLDSAYFRERFDAYPWLLTYLKQPSDGPFWRRNGLRFRPDDLRVPAYLVGGLLDGYRDTPLRALGYLARAPVKVEIGPWTHAWPDNGTPGPNYEWRGRAARWWNHWLRGDDTGLLDEPRLLVFQRTGHAPGADAADTPGHWRFEDWPVRGARRDTLSLAGNGRLVQGAAPLDTLQARTRAGSGTAAGEWWGEPTGDMRADDRDALVFDSPPLDSALVLLGFPALRFRAIHGDTVALWSARLEDVSPDGAVALVTGAALNATQHAGAEAPEALVPGRAYELRLDLHFTTWTFRPGHRIRLALAGAQFPMLWPAPSAAASQVVAGASALELPVVPARSAYPEPRLPAPEPRATRPGVRWILDEESGPVTTFDSAGRTTTVTWRSAGARRIGSTRYDYTEREQYTARDADPARASFHGVAVHRIRPPGRDLRLETTFDIQSDAASLHVLVRRRLWSGGRLIRTREWREAVPRRLH